jgi:2-polyprenyl-3-methyl-5-hydroxy-6-metoxy-1,4-benzoquinol methylase
MNKESYNKIAEQWVESRNQSKESVMVHKFGELIKKKGSILDVGCGSGIPIARCLLNKGFDVTGIDVSEKMIGMAKQNFNTVPFSLADINDYEPGKLFDGIIAWDSLFHLSPGLQHKAYRKVYSLLTDGGHFLFTAINMDGETVEDMFGALFSYGGIEKEKLKTMLKEIGFKFILVEEDYIEGDMNRDIVAILQK